MRRPTSSSEKEVRPRKAWASSALSNPTKNNASEKVYLVFIKPLSHAAHRWTIAAPKTKFQNYRRWLANNDGLAEAHPQKGWIVNSRLGPAHPPESAIQTLERYRGTVDRIAGDMVDLTLEDQHGELSAAKLSVAQMAEFGLLLTEDFDCTVTKQGSEVKVKFMPIPRRRLSPEASAKLRAEIDAAYQDFDDDF